MTADNRTYVDPGRAERDAELLRRRGFDARAVVEGTPHRRWWIRLERAELGPRDAARLLGRRWWRR